MLDRWAIKDKQIAMLQNAMECRWSVHDSARIPLNLICIQPTLWRFSHKNIKKAKTICESEKVEKQSFSGALNPDRQETGSVSEVLTGPRPCSGIYRGIQNDQKEGQAWIKSSHYFIYNCTGEFWGDAYFRSSVLNIFFSWDNRISFWILENHCDVEKWVPDLKSGLASILALLSS